MKTRDNNNSTCCSSKEMNILLDDLQELCYKIREEISDDNETEIINPVLNWIDSYDVKADPFKDDEK